MKILFLILSLVIAMPAWGADAAKTQSDPSAAQTEKVKDAAKETKAAPGDKNKGEEAKNEVKTPEAGEYSCKFYTVKLPEGWKAIMPPTEQQGLTNAIFARNSGNPAVSILVGENGGADARTIAEMFAEQFKASRPPAEKNGQYTFQYSQHDGITADVTVAAGAHDFMVVTVTGNGRDARKFLRENVTSEEYKDLLPKL